MRQRHSFDREAYDLDRAREAVQEWGNLISPDDVRRALGLLDSSRETCREFKAHRAGDKPRNAEHQRRGMQAAFSEMWRMILDAFIVGDGAIWADILQHHHNTMIATWGSPAQSEVLNRLRHLKHALDHDIWVGNC